MRRQAIRCTLSALLRDEQLVFVDSLSLDAPKTKAMQDILNTVAGTGSALVLVAERNENVERSIHNLKDAHVIRASYLNVRDLLKFDKVVVPLDALDVIKSIWGQEK